jgi:uncharacterized protein Usg
MFRRLNESNLILQIIENDLAPEERLPRLNVYYQFWRHEHDGDCAGALHAGVQARGG